MIWEKPDPYYLESGAFRIAVYYTGETCAFGLWKGGQQLELFTGIDRHDAKAKADALAKLKRKAEESQ